MPYTTNVPGTAITAAWGNANVRDQVVTPFATAAARASAVTSPVEGMLSYRADADVFEGYDGTRWAPVSYPAMVAGSKITNTGAPIATTSGTTELDLAKLALTGLTLVTGRTYKIHTSWLFTKGTASDAFDMKLRANTAVSGTQVGGSMPLHTDSTIGQVDGSWLIVGDSSWTSLYISVVRTAGASTISYFGASGGLYRSWSYIEDMGVTGWSDIA